MGGQGSGRKRERPGAEDSGRLDVGPLAEQLRRARAEGRTTAAGALSWRRGALRCRALYTLYALPAGAWVEVEPPGGRGVVTLPLVEQPSNLGRGALLFWRCGCGQLARLLYPVEGSAGWRCRRCVRPVYSSSRSSDARVSRMVAALLAADGAEDVARILDLGPPVALPLDRLPGARDLAATLGPVDRLILALRALDKLGGPGLLDLRAAYHGRPPRPRRMHAAAGRPRPR